MKKVDAIPLGSQELKKRLPRGAIKALANKYGDSLVRSSKVVSGNMKGDPRIVEDAQQMAKVEDEKKAALHLIVRSDKSKNIAV